MPSHPERASPHHGLTKPPLPRLAALFAALFQTLRYCPPERRGPILVLLETRLGSVHDDLEKKISQLLYADSMSQEDRIYSLWMLYMSFIHYPHARPGMQIWIGPDLFSDDQRACLRLRGPGADLPDPMVLQGELTILAQAVNKRAGAEIRQSGPEQLSISVRGQYP